MKNIFLTLTVALGFTATIFGQQNKLDIGLVGSPSMIFLRGNDYIKESHKPKVGFSGGLSLQYNYPNTFSLRTDIQFERKGSVVPGAFTDIVGNVVGEDKPIHVNFNYLTVPILLRATFGKKTKCFVNAGTFLGYLIKQTFVYPAGTILPDGSDREDNTKNDKRLDFGATAGLGLSIPIKDKFLIAFEIRDNLGLYNVSAVPIDNDGTIKTNSTNLLISFSYKLGSRQTETK